MNKQGWFLNTEFGYGLKVTAGPVSAWKPNAFDIRMQFAYADMPRKSYTHKNIFVNLFVWSLDQTKT